MVPCPMPMLSVTIPRLVPSRRILNGADVSLERTRLRRLGSHWMPPRAMAPLSSRGDRRLVWNVPALPYRPTLEQTLISGSAMFFAPGSTRMHAADHEELQRIIRAALHTIDGEALAAGKHLPILRRCLYWPELFAGFTVSSMSFWPSLATSVNSLW